MSRDGRLQKGDCQREPDIPKETSLAAFHKEFVSDAYAHWKKHGAQAFELLFAESPSRYVTVMASLFPREIAVDVAHRYVVELPPDILDLDTWQEQTKKLLPSPE
jgi:hypothetical protein